MMSHVEKVALATLLLGFLWLLVMADEAERERQIDADEDGPYGGCSEWRA